ncbi:S8 family serine peptidase [Wenyingzhuangia sp. chi5]|uniref:S8 family serine peptidase n=1 Tax=Wenyingzhuangia gilva TaxID=3057677 RepID=A0ABT8VRG1_9FLAO|nr:S8 family serine peptidase [Wenyingzhuangia sp. chi5]MDO3694564.1 S8 family serine peptidase [Wenyingzhuangia sp. chi5]
MKKFVFLMFLCSSMLQAQEHAWVYFKDKPNAQTYLSNPLSMLSKRAIDRRNRQNISITTQDVPVDEFYVLSVKNSNGITVKATSKWLNAVHVYGSETAITNLQNLTSVDSIQFANKNLAVINTSTSKLSKVFKINKFDDEVTSIYNYGEATNQTEMLGVEKFHQENIKGQGIQIAIIDAGFYGVNTAGAFSHLLDGNETNGEILGGYDFVHAATDYYAFTGTTHGTKVLSTIAAIKENEFVGTAPKASFYLFVTEDDANETPLEESLWVQAAERADSLGVDIINTSLGYSEFDESKYNYTYADMDGETTFITRGANIAAQKGMVLVNSMGNSGNDTWHYLTAPADAENIISVGAVDANENMVSFSSFGPSADNRIKPETLAQGGNVFVVNEENQVGISNGTSFSGPIIAGAVACLWEMYPNKTSLEIRQMVMEHSKDYLNPTDQRGFGVLNMNDLAPQLLSEFLYKGPPFYIIYGNHGIYVQLHQNFDEVSIQVFSTLGNYIVDKKLTKNNNGFLIENLSPGIYYVKYQFMGKSKVMTFFKREYGK